MKLVISNFVFENISYVQKYILYEDNNLVLYDGSWVGVFRERKLYIKFCLFWHNKRTTRMSKRKYKTQRNLTLFRFARLWPTDFRFSAKLHFRSIFEWSNICSVRLRSGIGHRLEPEVTSLRDIRWTFLFHVLRQFFIIDIFGMIVLAFLFCLYVKLRSLHVILMVKVSKWIYHVGFFLSFSNMFLLHFYSKYV